MMAPKPPVPQRRLPPRGKPVVVASPPPSPPEKLPVQVVVDETPDPNAVPELPEGQTLGEVGMKVWSKLTKMLRQRGIYSEDYLGPLYTLCSLEDTAAKLRDEFIDNLTIEVRGNTKLNPAVTEWSKIVAQLKSFYTEFDLTPRAVRTGSGTATGQKVDEGVETARDLGQTKGEGIFDPI